MSSTSTDDIHPLVERVLLAPSDIQSSIERIGRKIASDYADKRPLVVIMVCLLIQLQTEGAVKTAIRGFWIGLCETIYFFPIAPQTLKGAIIFASDLLRSMAPLPDDLELSFVRASSYGAGTSSTGKVKLPYDDAKPNGRHVILIEDIVDSGRTAVALKEHYLARGAVSVKMAALLSKPSRREVEFEPDYLCFEVPNEFVVGYGLDFDQKLRSLPYIGVLKREAYSG